MKKAFLILMAAVLSLSVLSSCKGKGSDFSEPYTDVYNDDGTIEKKVYYNEDKSVESEVYYEYDKSGNIVTETKKLADGSLEFKVEYEYKSVGDEMRVAKRTVYANEKDIEFYESDYEYEAYDNNGQTNYREASHIEYNADGNEKSKWVYVYDEQGVLKKIVTYDPKGNVISESEING
ncbi:MAG: hypothetical protein IJS17_05625 [Clostridia bacterium]|nr:hypothetical protein [Clostridia bacterium]